MQFNQPGCLGVSCFSETLHLCNDALKQRENEMTYTVDDYLDSLHCEVDSCYRDLAYDERIGHQSRVDEVERVIASIKKKIEEVA